MTAKPRHTITMKVATYTEIDPNHYTYRYTRIGYFGGPDSFNYEPHPKYFIPPRPNKEKQ